MKKIGMLLIASIMFIGNNTVLTQNNFVSAQAAKDEITVTYNGEKILFDQEPIIENGRTKVPFRKIFENMGAVVYYNSNKQSILALNKNGDIITHKIGTSYASVNGEEKQYDSKSNVLNGRTLVPVRMISDLLGADVEWIGEERKVVIEKEEEKLDSVQKDVMSHILDINYNPKDTKRYIEYKRKNPQMSTEQAIMNVNMDLDREFILYSGEGMYKDMRHYDSKIEEREEIENPDDILTLVNNYNTVPEDYEPSDLVNLTESTFVHGNFFFNMFLRKEAAEKYKEMLAAFTDNNDQQYSISGYTTHSGAGGELEFRRNYAQNGMDGNPTLPQNGLEEYAFVYSSEAEMNERRLGNSFEAKYPEQKILGEYLQNHYGVHSDELDNYLNEVNNYMKWGNVYKYYPWLKDNSYKYGFILRYPDGKQSITRKEYMPWLFRYVGVDVATQMYNEHLCFEEYYAKYYNPVVNDNNYLIDPESTQKIISQF